MRLHRTWIIITLLGSNLFGGVIRAENTSSDELKSPDGQYEVRMLPTPSPGANEEEDRTLAVYHHEHLLSKIPSYGYLLNAYWSGDGKYVAAVNRRSNTGDYLWVFRLKDGHAIKTPIDSSQNPHASYKGSVEAIEKVIRTKYPELKVDGVNKYTTFTEGWTRSGELKVRTNVRYSGLDDQYVLIKELYSVREGRLFLLTRKVEKQIADGDATTIW